jgi:hypothetical protein
VVNRFRENGHPPVSRFFSLLKNPLSQPFSFLNSFSDFNDVILSGLVVKPLGPLGPGRSVA